MTLAVTADGLGNLDIVAAKIVSDPSSDLLLLGKGRNSSGDNEKMERGVWIQFNVCVSIFALYWHHICSTLGDVRKPRELVKQDICTALCDRMVKWYVIKCQVNSVGAAWRGMSRRTQFRGWKSQGRRGGFCELGLGGDKIGSGCLRGTSICHSRVPSFSRLFLSTVCVPSTGLDTVYQMSKSE